MKLPLWVKISIVLALLSIAGTVLSAVSPSLILPVAAIIIMLFPGPDAANPRLVRWIPWFWALDALVGLVFAIAMLMGKDLFPPEQRHPSMLEICSSIVMAGPMIWLLVKRHRLFKPVLIFSAVLFSGFSIWDYQTDPSIDLRAKIELISDLLTQVLLTAYLLVKVRAHKGELAHQQHEENR